MLRRRDILATALTLPAAAARAQSAPQPRELVIDWRTIPVGDRPARVYRLGPPGGGSGLVLGPGERFHVRLTNQLDEPSIVHWHGQTAKFGQDGAPPETPIPPHGQRVYDFSPRPGTHWMHSHFGLQEQRLLAAPLIVRDAEDARQDMQDIVLLLHDFAWRDPSDLLADLRGGGHGMHMAGPAQLNDVIFDELLANDRTLADPRVMRVRRSQLVRLRVINAASASQFWLDLGGLEATLLATDGNPIVPVPIPTSIPLAIAQRLDIALRMPASGAFPILAQLEGTAKRTGIVLATPDANLIPFLDMPAPQAMPPVDLSLDRRLRARAPLAARNTDARHRLILGGDMGAYRWNILAEGRDRPAPVAVQLGQRVEIEFVNRTPMAHPMHLHGHHFQVVGDNRGRFAGPLRDTVLVPAGGGSVSIAFDADNPGRWLLHCHNLYHMAAGMMTEIAYAGLS